MLPFGRLASAEESQKTLRVVMQSDLRIVDPIWSTAYIIRDHGYMIYDTLFALAANGDVKPQMVDTYDVSNNGLTCTFKLREGLLWHDRRPVTTADIIPSIKRWAARDAFGQSIMTFIDGMEAKDDLTFVIRPKEPTGLLISAPGKPSSNVPFMMPKRVAETDPNTQISEFVGSGPFVFLRDEWRPGDRSVYVKFDGYKPRSEPPSGLAGGKVVKVTRVEWRVLADQQQAVNALLANEVDIVQQPSQDLLPLLRSDQGVKVVDWNPYGYQYYFRFNQAVPPFDNPKIRQAVLYAFNQEDFLKAGVGDPQYYKPCKAMFVCGTPLATDAGMEDKLESNFAKSKQLLQEAGYKGEPIVLLHVTDVQQLINLGPVAKSLLERGGFFVDMHSMDWQTVLARRVKKELPSRGGWNAAMSSFVTADVLNPLMASFFNASGNTANFGWPNDPEMEKLRARFARAPSLAKQQEIAKDIQLREAENPTHVHLGQFYIPGATRSNISGWVPAAAPVFWNIEKQK
jgi:peptide/nickel transport system substrate-binding protein